MTAVSDLFLVVLDSPCGLIALTPEELVRAQARVSEALPSRANFGDSLGAKAGCPLSFEPLLTAQSMAEKTGVPASWFESAAQRGEIKHYKIGRWVRFRLTEVLDCPRVANRRTIGSPDSGHADRSSAAPRRRGRKKPSRPVQLPGKSCAKKIPRVFLPLENPPGE